MDNITIINTLIKKLSSGRFLLTIATAVVFVYATVAKILPSEAVASVVSTVFAIYFLKNENHKEEK